MTDILLGGVLDKVCWSQVARYKHKKGSKGARCKICSGYKCGRARKSSKK